jgi:hypothetical protein
VERGTGSAQSKEKHSSGRLKRVKRVNVTVSRGLTSYFLLAFPCTVVHSKTLTQTYCGELKTHSHTVAFSVRERWTTLLFENYWGCRVLGVPLI